MIISPLQKARSGYQPILPRNLNESVKIVEGNHSEPKTDKDEIRRLFPHT